MDGHKLLVYGGWNCDTQLSDCHMLDTDTLSWSAMVRSFITSIMLQNDAVKVLLTTDWIRT